MLVRCQVQVVHSKLTENDTSFCYHPRATFYRDLEQTDAGYCDVGENNDVKVKCMGRGRSPSLQNRAVCHRKLEGTVPTYLPRAFMKERLNVTITVVLQGR